MSNRKLSNHSNEGKKIMKRVSIPYEHEKFTVRLSDLGIVKTSPSEMELQIQTERIVYVLDETIKKLQVAASLPRLLKHDACSLVAYVLPQELEFIKCACANYTEGVKVTKSHFRTPSTQQLFKTIEKIGLRETKKRMLGKVPFSIKSDPDTFSDRNIAQVIEIIWNNNILRDYVLEEYDSMPNSNYVVFVNCIKSLKEAAIYRLSISAAEEGAREKRLRKAWILNSESEQYINATKILLEKQKKELKSQLKVKKEIVAKYTIKIENFRDKLKNDIKYKIQESEKEMAQDTAASVFRQVDLSVEAKTVTQQYDMVLNQHLRHEKHLRNKRSKVETQLSGWLNKYDADVGERQAEFEKFAKGFDVEKIELDALQKKFNEQEKIYVVLMAEKEAEIRKAWEARAYIFLCNRSARKIQRCWKAYLQRKIERKKAKKEKAKAKKEKTKNSIETITPVEPISLPFAVPTGEIDAPDMMDTE